MVDQVRYWMGVLLAVSTVPAVLHWVLIHPAARFWRRIGPLWSYVVISPILVGMGYGVWLLREPILGRDLGTLWPLIVAGSLLYLLSASLEVRIRRHLPLSTFVGIPELSGRADADALVRKGIYAHVRHPRYLAVLLGTTGWALVVNFAGLYILMACLAAALYGVIILEERELLERFGPAYEEYRRGVPRLIPRGMNLFR
jgi:protein-S-isoprenylcysteine O-methyltransferase Ste14